MEHQLTNTNDIKTFVLAGNATFTIVSKSTKNRFTFRVKAPSKANKIDLSSPMRFVSVMTGSDNDSDYSYLGFFSNGNYRQGGTKAKVSQEATSAKAFAYLAQVMQQSTMPSSLEFWASNRCARCNRTLTVPSSVKRFLGPDCAEIMGFVAESA